MNEMIRKLPHTPSHSLLAAWQESCHLHIITILLPTDKQHHMELPPPPVKHLLNILSIRDAVLVTIIRKMCLSNCQILCCIYLEFILISFFYILWKDPISEFTKIRYPLFSWIVLLLNRKSSIIIAADESTISWGPSPTCGELVRPDSVVFAEKLVQPF